jgi:D-3-phosphoglycerate dehydrogenase|tara:strand:- start:2198 stop:3130 length:933 start_codon:yes stop_codon:yes gene_type:complete
MKLKDRKKILIGPSSFGDCDRTPLHYLVKLGYEVIDNPFKRRLKKDELFDLLEDGVVGLIAGLEPLDKEVMQKSNLKVISRCGSGMSNVDVDAAKGMGIQVYSTPNAPTTAVAEATVGALLSILRFVPQMNQDMHQYKWNKRIGKQLQGKYVAIIGYGRIGQRVEQILHAFNAEVAAVDPILSGNKSNVPVIGFEEALTRADIFLLHCSGDSPLFGDREFGLMKRGVYLINAARGGLVDEEAFIKALDRGQIAGAWLDTFDQEPYSGPLCQYEQVMLTPHIGSYTVECRRQMELEAVNNLIKGFEELEGV